MNAEIAAAALAYYNLPKALLTFLGQSENTSFKVETSENTTFLLRIHTGINSTDDAQNVWRHAAVIESELLWLDALAGDAGLTVPRPVQNNFGQWVTLIANAQSEPVVCSLLQWVEGQHLQSEPTPAQLWQLGALLAQLHEHSSRWLLPPSFNRPAYNAQHLQRSLSQLGKLFPKQKIPSTDQQLLEKAVAKIQDLMVALPRTPDVWGLIHADLHDRNYLFHEHQARAIDFSLCGFGFYVYDIGMSLGFIEAPRRHHLLEGYTSIRTLAKDYLSIIEAFFIAATVDNFAWLNINPQEHEGLTQAISDVASNHIRPYLQGKTFLYQK